MKDISYHTTKHNKKNIARIKECVQHLTTFQQKSSALEHEKESYNTFFSLLYMHILSQKTKYAKKQIKYAGKVGTTMMVHDIVNCNLNALFCDASGELMH